MVEEVEVLLRRVEGVPEGLFRDGEVDHDGVHDDHEADHETMDDHRAHFQEVAEAAHR